MSSRLCGLWGAADVIPTREEMYQSLAARHGAEMQQRLAAASAAICGLGGLGSNIAVALARAGIGKLHLIDFDRVDLSNLNRQQYFPSQIGQYKTEALKDTLSRIAPYCALVTDTVRLDADNIPQILQDDPIICEAFDRADAKAMLVNTVLETFPEAYLVAASGMAGMDSANTIRTRRIAKRFYLCGDGESDLAEGTGLFASRVMLCAAHQAHTVIRIIAGQNDC